MQCWLGLTAPDCQREVLGVLLQTEGTLEVDGTMDPRDVSNGKDQSRTAAALYRHDHQHLRTFENEVCIISSGEELDQVRCWLSLKEAWWQRREDRLPKLSS